MTIDPGDKNRTPMQSIRSSDNLDMESLDNSVQQLIRETDEAFQAVGTALVEANAATQRWQRNIIPEPVAQEVSIPRSDPGTDTEASAITPIITHSFVKRTKRKYLRSGLLNQVRKGRDKNVNPPRTLTGVTANVVETIGSIMFKIEADEMLSSDRLRMSKQREKKAIDKRLEDKADFEGKSSLQSSYSAGMDGSTPKEPFHLESISSSLATSTLSNLITMLSSSPTVRLSAEQHRRTSPTRKGLRVVQPKTNPSGLVVGLQNPKDPSYPLFSHAKLSSFPSLPTILDVSPLSLAIPTPHFERRRGRQFSLESIQPPPNYITLPSTSFTLMCPFEQGPIRIERKEKEAKPDEVLDWTAFQIAILGTMNETGVGERDDIEWAADETAVDEILEWWVGYGFPGYGQMTQGKPWKKNFAADAVVIKTHIKNVRSRRDTDNIEGLNTVQDGHLGWTVSTSYAESMPPSPTLDLVPLRTANVDIVPMGFNLGDDLEDFLDWETNYVRKFHNDD